MPADAQEMRPTVFISYAHESEALRASVKVLADWLGNHGCSVLTDHPYVHRPPERGWQVWMHDCVRKADVVLVVCTPKLKARYEKNEKPGTGFGATHEGAIVTQHIYDAAGRNTKFYPILPDGGSYDDVPTSLRPWWNGHSFPAGNKGIRGMIFDRPAARSSPPAPEVDAPPQGSGTRIDRRPLRIPGNLFRKRMGKKAWSTAAAVAAVALTAAVYVVSLSRDRTLHLLPPRQITLLSSEVEAPRDCPKEVTKERQECPLWLSAVLSYTKPSSSGINVVTDEKLTFELGSEDYMHVAQSLVDIWYGDDRPFKMDRRGPAGVFTVDSANNRELLFVPECPADSSDCDGYKNYIGWSGFLAAAEKQGRVVFIFHARVSGSEEPLQAKCEVQFTGPLVDRMGFTEVMALPCLNHRELQEPPV